MFPRYMLRRFTRASFGGFSIEEIILAIVGGLIVILLFANLLPVLVGPIFNTTQGAVSLYNAFHDIWKYALTPLLGATAATTLAPYVAVASIIGFAIALTFGVVEYIRRKLEF